MSLVKTKLVHSYNRLNYETLNLFEINIYFSKRYLKTGTNKYKILNFEKTIFTLVIN